MKVHDLEIWIIDTVFEGGHSFKDLRDCILNNATDVDDAWFLKVVESLFDHGFIDVFYDSGSSKIEKMEFDAARSAIYNYAHIVEENAKTRASHFLEVTELGKRYLVDNGITI